jgi:hypothetical protein
VVDITQRLRTEPVFFVLDGREYRLNDDKNTVLAAMKAVQDGGDGDTEGMDEALALFLGEGPAREVAEGLSFAGYNALFTSVMAEVTQTPYEEAEARFQQERQGG